ncbi:MAG TPA: twin-arginine translocase TatA/TatE family subunit [Proteobacteria bacterium]|nr:twin-arginine translocase TatA/TatE family subunit [Pseudomonadota bacterium]
MQSLPLLLFSGLGWPEILIILLIVLLLFGAKRIPEIARSLGQGMKEFKKGIKEIGHDLEEEEGKKRGSSRSTESQEKAKKEKSLPREEA